MAKDAVADASARPSLRSGRATLLVAAALVFGCGPSGTPRDAAATTDEHNRAAIPRPDLQIKIENALRNIGLEYLNAASAGSVAGPDALGREVSLKNPRDGEPFEIVWRVDPSRLPDGASRMLLAWEKRSDAKGGRYVLMADCHTTRYLTDAEFERTPKATPAP